MFFIIGVQNKFRNIRRATPVLESLLKTLILTLLKKILKHMYFLVNIANFFRTAFFIESLCWVLLTLTDFKQFCTNVSVYFNPLQHSAFKLDRFPKILNGF